MEMTLRGTSTEWQRSTEATRPAHLQIDPVAFKELEAALGPFARTPRVVAAVAGWLLVQVATQVLPIFDVSALALRRMRPEQR